MHEICVIVYFISPVHIHTIRPHLTQWLPASKEDSVLKTATVNSGISSRTIVESLVIKNPVPIPAEMGTTDNTCPVLLFLQLVRVAYPKISVKIIAYQ